MRQHPATKAVRPYLMRLTASGTRQPGPCIEEVIQGKSSVYENRKTLSAKGFIESTADRCYSLNDNSPSIQGEKDQPKGDWWFSVKLEHPHVAIELIESYKWMTGASLDDITYNLYLL